MIGSAEMAAEAKRIEKIRREIAESLCTEWGCDCGLETREIIPLPGTNEDSYGYTIDLQMTVQYDDWIHLGRGVSRSVWLGPDGVAYKVPFPGATPQNVYEYTTFEKYERLSDPNRRGRIPVCSLYDDVLATEYIEGIPAYKYNENDEVSEVESVLDLSDLHAWNVILEPSGRMTIVDFAC